MLGSGIPTILDFIQKKQHGEELSSEEIARFVSGYSSGEIPDYQVAALLMAIYFEGLSRAETVALTKAIIASGEALSYSPDFAPVLDKHSTGGVGDKTSLLLVPMLAAAGYKVPKMSGRGLGHTGGTIDKLESIPGFRAELSHKELMRQLQQVGCAIVSQSPGLVLVEKKLYALRDATATVASDGLIAASILSKKIAAGASHLIIDVKHGSGAFFPRKKDARVFAESIVALAREFPPRVMAAVTWMGQPLGRTVGNALEVQEGVSILEAGDAEAEVARLSILLGGALLHFAGETATRQEGEARLAETLGNRSANEKFKQMVAAQGGRLEEFTRLMKTIEERTQRVEVNAPVGGHIRRLDALAVGCLCRRLGSGRARMTDSIDPWVGVVFSKKVGDEVAPGEVIATAYAPMDGDPQAIAEELLGAYDFGEQIEPPELVSGFVE